MIVNVICIVLLTFLVNWETIVNCSVEFLNKIDVQSLRLKYGSQEPFLIAVSVYHISLALDNVRVATLGCLFNISD